MDEDLLTIKEIAKRLDLPESNVRYYRDRFEEFLPYVGQGRKRRYTIKALEVFTAVVEGLKQNLTSEEIALRLAREFPRGLVLETGKGGELPMQTVHVRNAPGLTELIQSQSKVLERLAEALVGRQAGEAELEGIRQVQTMLRKGLGLLWKDYRRNRQRLKVGQVSGTVDTGQDLPEADRQWRVQTNLQLQRIETLERRQSDLEARLSELQTVLERLADALSRLPEFGRR